MEIGSAPEQSNDYFDFELEIGIGNGREYPVHVVRSIAGEARETMHFPFDTPVLENRLLTLQNALLSGGRFRRIPSREEQTVQDFGQALFNALFVGEVRSRYAVSKREAEVQGKGLRVKLRIQSPQLITLPWEFLYDAGHAEYICLSSNTPIVRYIELPQPPRPLTVALPLRILVMLVNPQNLSSLDVENEKLRIERAAEALQSQGLVSITWLQGQTRQALQQAMRRGPWHVFHFIGHGGFDHTNDEGLIALADSEGYASYLKATHLGRLLSDHRSLRLVVLNSCEGARGSKEDIFSSTASILVQRGIPAVLAMQYEITDGAAVELSRVFYESLAEGMPVDMAVGEARKAISVGVANSIEWGTPVLYMHSPDGALFNIKERQDTEHTIFFNKQEISDTTRVARRQTQPLFTAPPDTQVARPTYTRPTSSPITNTSLQQPRSFIQTMSPQNSSVDSAARSSNKSTKRASKIVISIGLLFVILTGVLGVDLSNSIRNDEIHGTATASTQALLDGSATAQIYAVATATAFSIPKNWKVALDDPLINNSKGYKWDEDSVCKFISGSYHAISSIKNFFNFCSASPDFSNFVFQVQLIVLKGNCGGMEIRVVFSPNEKFYHYEVCQDASGGTTNLYSYSSNNNSQYIASTLFERSRVAIKLNQPVTVAVIANGSTIRMYLNQQIDYAVSSSAYTHGQIALMAENRGFDTEVAYKDAKVWTP